MFLLVISAGGVDLGTALTKTQNHRAMVQTMHQHDLYACSVASQAQFPTLCSSNKKLA